MPLKGRKTKGERKRVPNFWFTRVRISGTGSSGNQKPATLSTSSMWAAGTQLLVPLDLPLPPIKIKQEWSVVPGLKLSHSNLESKHVIMVALPLCQTPAPIQVF